MHHLYLTKDVSFLKMGQCDSDFIKCFTWPKKKKSIFGSAFLMLKSHFHLGVFTGMSQPEVHSFLRESL